MQPFSPSLLSLSIHSLKKKKQNKTYHLLSYLSVTHAGCSNEGLLDGVALLKHPLLLASHRPVTLNQKLDNLQMTSECSMDQSTLPILIQVIHLRDREACVNEGLWLSSQPRHMRPLHMSRLPRSFLPHPLDQTLRRFRGHAPARARAPLAAGLADTSQGRTSFHKVRLLFSHQKKPKSKTCSSSFVFLRYVLLCS